MPEKKQSKGTKQVSEQNSDMTEILEISNRQPNQKLKRGIWNNYGQYVKAVMKEIDNVQNKIVM